ncbi:gametocyte-specific factor 1 [Bicyclus anynana]|uniref:Gametocyte-specific factor 1 n=1 Tax=Bicyclus anynana TaxID=110368 RepID=A0A6J1NEN8_BICAN|nr:gametocyte-specific factor 1 [Bicyclus anynana]XP_052741662.1 gametocyte-specific factor 1 [Bicyclus anynana]
MNDSDWFTCPYNSAHRVPKLRFQRHLVKCEKQYPPLAICPYDARHRMPNDQLLVHVEDCPTRLALTLPYGGQKEFSSWAKRQLTADTTNIPSKLTQRPCDRSEQPCFDEDEWD